MAIYDNAMDYNDVDTAMDELYELQKHTKAQFHRQGDTSKWFKVRGQAMQGNRYHFKAFTQPSTGTRRASFASAAQGEFPVASDIQYVDLSIGYSDLTAFQVSIDVSRIAEMRTENREHAVYQLATKMIGEAERDAGSQLNAALHQAETCAMGLVSAVYSSAGASYLTATEAFIKVKSGSIAQFLPGQSIDIRAGGNSASVRLTATVNDVIAGPDGPWRSGTRVASIGPGIVVTRTSGSDANFDSVTANDEIVLSGELDVNFHGFPDWFSPGTNVYKDGDGNALDRDAKGYSWMIPNIVTAAADGAEVTLDLDTHLGQLADWLPFRVNFGRNERVTQAAAKGEDIVMGAAMVAITTPSLCNEATTEAIATKRFTSMQAGSVDAAKRRELVGEVGFDGMVWHSATLPPIAFQADPAAQPYRIRLIDPEAFFFTTMDGTQTGMKWLRNDNGGRFFFKRGTNGRLTFYRDAGAYAFMHLSCDQPGAMCEIRGVKSSRD